MVKPAGFVIRNIWAFCAIDEFGIEGTPMVFQPQDGTWVAMIGADEDRVRSYRPAARAYAKRTGHTVVLKKFSNYEIVETIKP